MHGKLKTNSLVRTDKSEKGDEEHESSVRDIISRISGLVNKIETSVEAGKPDDFTTRVRDLKLFLERYVSFNDEYTNCFDVRRFLLNIIPSLRGATSHVVIELMGLVRVVIEKFDVSDSHTLLSDNVLPTAYMRMLITKDNNDITREVIKLLTIMYCDAASDRIFGVLPFDAVVTYLESDEYQILHRDCAAYIEKISNYPVPSDKRRLFAECAFRFVEPIGNVSNYQIYGLWAIGNMFRDKPKNAQELVAALPGLPRCIEQLMNRDDSETLRIAFRAIVSIAECQCDMPGYRYRWALKATKHTEISVQCNAMRALRAMLLNRRVQTEAVIRDDEVFDVVTRLCEFSLSCPYGISEMLVVDIPLICMEVLPCMYYRRLVEQKLFHYLSRLCDDLVVYVHILSLLAKIFDQAERDGWVIYYIQAFSEAELESLAVAIHASERPEVIAVVDALIAKIHSEKT